MIKRNVLLALSLVAGILPAASLDPNNPTGKSGLILIDKLGHFARFFDPGTLQETSSVELDVAPHDLAISPESRPSTFRPTAMACTAEIRIPGIPSPSSIWFRGS